MNNTYEILGLKENATEAQIKNAYRALAKKYHPDVSKVPNAEEKFVEIAEAYEILTSKGTSNQLYDQADYEYHQEDKVHQRRQRARAYSKMKYETFKANNDAFKKSWYYNLIKGGLNFFIFLCYTLSAIMFASPIITWFITGDKIMSFIMVFVTLFSSHVYRFTKEMRIESKPYFENYD
jgi:curved DNA-binding protein CbpA